MSHAICLDESHHTIDSVRWTAQVLILTLVSPALVTVLVLGGLMVCGSKIFSATTTAAGAMLKTAKSLQS